MAHEIFFKVLGLRPVPWAGGEREFDWRRAIATKARSLNFQEQQSGITSFTTFEVELLFFINEASIQRVDLDNLAKPVLDTLFNVRRPQVKDISLTGAMFPVDDDRVFKLTLEKRQVSDDRGEGVQVRVRWE